MAMKVRELLKLIGEKKEDLEVVDQSIDVPSDEELDNAGNGNSTEIGPKGKKKKEDVGPALSDTEMNAGDGNSTDPAQMGDVAGTEDDRNKEAEAAETKGKKKQDAEDDEDEEELEEAYRAHQKKKRKKQDAEEEAEEAEEEAEEAEEEAEEAEEEARGKKGGKRKGARKKQDMEDEEEEKGKGKGKKKENFAQEANPKENKMHKLLGLKADQEISDYGSASGATDALVKKVGQKEATGMINFAANLNPDDKFLQSMQDHLKEIPNESKVNPRDKQLVERMRNLAGVD